MATIIDRRPTNRDKNLNNRRKFIQRSRSQIKQAVKDAIDQGNITDIENRQIKAKVKNIDEPVFGVNPKTGNRRYVIPGNDKYIVGDREDKPESSGGSGSGGGLGESTDDFVFVLNQEEFLDFIFEDLELPDMVKKQMRDLTVMRNHRSGFTNCGNPSQLDVIRSLRNGLGRRIGLNRPSDSQIEELESDIESCKDAKQRHELIHELELLKSRQKIIPWLDPIDIRYRNYVQVPEPTCQAVMICIMDVSGSMGQKEKDLAKRFFFLLHMFLRRKYDKVDIVFIKHHERASEVDEHDFFYSKESGGTIVSSALELAKKIIDERYPVNDWNIFAAQLTDGDNFNSDNERTRECMTELLPLIQYYAYVEIRPSGAYRSSDIWDTYYELKEKFKNLNMQQIFEIPDIWRVFKNLFEKDRKEKS